MKKYSTQIRVEAEHIDSGEHANWLAQLGIAQKVHSAFREELGIGLDKVKSHDLFFMMRNVKDVLYRKQLRLGDVIAIEMTLWISRPTCLEFHCLFRQEGEIATEMNWLMPLVSTRSERVCKIPQWMIDLIGSENPIRPT